MDLTDIIKVECINYLCAFALGLMRVRCPQSLGVPPTTKPTPHIPKSPALKSANPVVSKSSGTTLHSRAQLGAPWDVGKSVPSAPLVAEPGILNVLIGIAQYSLRAMAQMHDLDPYAHTTHRAIHGPEDTA